MGVPIPRQRPTRHYYQARYYDPKVGVFLSADAVEGNGVGRDPYAYVGDNPETKNDPTGHCPICLGAIFIAAWLGSLVLTEVSVAMINAPPSQSSNYPPNRPQPGPAPTPGPTPTPAPPPSSSYATTAASSVQDTSEVVNSLIWAAHRPHPEPPPQPQPGSSGQLPPGGRPPTAVAGAPCSFTSQTQVTTDHGKQDIGQLHEGDKVLAYNPQTQQMELEPIVHVWKHSDHDLVDLTLTSTPSSQQGKSVGEEDAVNSVIQSQHHKSAKPKGEVVHTTSEHPFFTTEQGFVPAGKLKVGMQVLRADGSVGVVTGWKVVSGTKVMYNLEVAHDHTFVVGEGQWVVHNLCEGGPLGNNLVQRGRAPTFRWQAHHLLPCEVATGGQFAHNLVTTAEAANPPGWINEVWNGMGLPVTDADSIANGLPIHVGSHDNYTFQVLDLLDRAEAVLVAKYGPLTGPIATRVSIRLANALRNIIIREGAIETAGGFACTIDDIAF